MIQYQCDCCGARVPESEVVTLKAVAGSWKKKRPQTHLCLSHAAELQTFFQPPESPGSGKAARTAPKGPGPRNRPSAN